MQHSNMLRNITFPGFGEGYVYLDLVQLGENQWSRECNKSSFNEKR